MGSLDGSENADNPSLSLIDTATLNKAAHHDIYDRTGRRLYFGSLYENDKVIVVFTRHFHCGRCQDYAAQLASVRPEALSEAAVKLILVGCGDWKLIDAYHENTRFRGEIYADPTQALYKTLDMMSNLDATPAGATVRSYVQGSSAVSNALKSIWRGPLSNPSHIGKQGPYSQLGGDFILGPGEICSFASRMRHTQDHVEVAELMQAAGVSYP